MSPLLNVRFYCKKQRVGFPPAGCPSIKSNRIPFPPNSAGGEPYIQHRFARLARALLRASLFACYSYAMNIIPNGVAHDPRW